MRFNHPVSHLVVAGQLQSHINDLLTEAADRFDPSSGIAGGRRPGA